MRGAAMGGLAHAGEDAGVTVSDALFLAGATAHPPRAPLGAPPQ
jgi:hypothetical protein